MNNRYAGFIFLHFDQGLAALKEKRSPRFDYKV